jgi:hypothetical protein
MSWVIEKKVNNNKKISQGYLKTRPRTTTSIQKDILNKVNNNNKNYYKGYLKHGQQQQKILKDILNKVNNYNNKNKVFQRIS